MKASLIYFLLLLLIGCSGGDGSILDTPIQKDPGSLAILNTSGFMGATVAGTSLDHVVSIKAAGGLKLTDLNVTLTTNDPISFKGGSYPGTGGTCGTLLDSGDTCSIVLIYEPSDTNSHLATLTFTYQDALRSYQKTHQVSADSHPILTFEYGTVYDFGNKFLGTSTDLRIRISNTGRVVAESISVNNLGLPFSMKGGSYPGTGGTCGNSLSPGQTCDIYVNYSPTANGEHLQNITLTYLNTGRIETNTLRMLAWGFTQAQLTVSDTTGYNFGTVAAGMAHDKVFTITHSGGDVSASALNLTNLSGPFTFKGGNYPGTGGTCTRTLTKDTGSCTIIVTLSTSVSGTWSNALSFSYFNGTQTLIINRSIEAITRQRAQISFSPTGTQSFGVIALSSSAPRTFTVSYTGGEMPATGFGFSSLNSLFNYAGGSYPGTGGTCGSSLNSGSCTISLSYSSSIHGVHSLNTNFVYNNGATNLTAALLLQGRTESSVSTSSNTAFGNVVNGQTGQIILNMNISNGNGITDFAGSFTNSVFSFKGGPFPGTGGGCTTSINASTICSIVLNFNPLTEGNHTGILNLTYNGGVGTKTYSLTLTGNSTPAANITIPDTNFGSTSVNSAKEMVVTVTNSSTISPIIVDWSFPAGFGFKGGSFPGLGGTCWSTTCSIVLVFTPTQAITYSGPLSFTYNDGTGNIKTASANLTGEGFLTNDLFLSNFNTVNFTSIYVGQSFSRAFTLSHGGGNAAAVISSKSIANATDYTIINDTCPGSLNNGATCTFTVKFEPVSAGMKDSSLNINYDNGASKTTSRLVTGSGTNPGLLTASQASLAFGERSPDSFYDLTVVFTHSGSPSATNLNRLVTGTGFSRVADNCPTNMNPGTSCSITVRFTPTSAINYTGNLAVTYGNGFSTVTTNVPLSGAGIPTARLTFAASSYNFGQIIQTQSSSLTITLNHTGPVAATAMSANTLSAPFSYKGGSYPGTGGTCADTLSSGPCTMVIDFAPTSTGVRNQTLSITYNNGADSRMASTALTGEGLAQAIISISETNPYNFGTVNVGGVIDKSFILTNGGSVSGTSLSGSFDSSFFNFKGGSFPGTGGSCGASLGAGASCSIVLSFGPTSAQAFSGTFTLNYNDGLRVQSEYKNLTGTGSVTLMAEKYLSLLSDIPFTEKQRVYVQQSLLEAEITSKEITLFGEWGEVIFKETNHLYPLIEGVIIGQLPQDNNQDGLLDLLFSIHDEDSNLKGYSIRCRKSGRVLERYDGRPSN
jgi:hypothetical protein